MEATVTKPRIRVKAGSVASRPMGGVAPRPEAYLRDTKSGIIASRRAPLRLHRDDVRHTWVQAAAIAADIMQNSGKIRGAADQVISDTVGAELIYNPQPDLSGLGYSDQEKAEFINLLKLRWKQWAWNPRECDARGKFTIPQMVDIGLRWDMVYGELTGLISYMPPAERRRYGLTTGTKVTMVPPPRLVQDTNEIDGMVQGVIHDPNGRVAAYRFRERESGIDRLTDWRAFDAEGRAQVMHIFDPQDAEDVRGISRLVPAFRQHLQHEVAQDTTLQTFILQTMWAASLTSELPSAEAFEAIESIKDIPDLKGVYSDFMGMLGAQLEAAKEARIGIGGDPQVNHLGPGERLQFHSSATPGPQYQPFTASLDRAFARAIGITYGAYTLDYTDATYSSNQMENASIYPVVVRRRERLSAPQCQMICEAWLDEEIGEGRIPFKGGYAAFAANRQRVSWAQWRGPAKPTADDTKSARAASERIANGTSTLESEISLAGGDPDEVFETRLREHKRYVDAGMVSPFERGFNIAQTPGEPEERSGRRAST